MISDRLPIHALRDEFERRTGDPLVISSPTGSGKSTEVPRWCSGRTLVVEPRRVACRALAARIAELESSSLGDVVGYHVRDDRQASDATRILFATPGIVLQRTAMLDEFERVILDEFHERRLDTDLLYALLHERRPGPIVMSATLDGDRVAQHLGGVHLQAEGRAFPVDVRYLGGELLPDPHGLERRVLKAVEIAATLEGHVLVFLPGKGEIAAVAERLRYLSGWELFELHGGQSLQQQAKVFADRPKRKLVLTTNVAETSVTVPGVGVVIDSGLVRRTRYHRGRGYLTLTPIARDSADQRAGRAGRTQAGTCLRLWEAAGQLQPATPPEIFRESLVPLLLSAAACGRRVDDLDFLDAPHAHALSAAQSELENLGALSGGELTDAGRALFGLPIDPWLGRLLVEARGTASAHDAVDLAAALAVGRQLFRERPDDPDDDLRRGGCDATALIEAVRNGRVGQHGLSKPALSEARSNAKRLRRALGLQGAVDTAPDVAELMRVIIRADPRACHVARRRKRRTTFSNGGTEIELGRQSAVEVTDKLEAIVVFETRAIGTGPRGTKLLATAASPIRFKTMAALGVGEARVGRVDIDAGRLVAKVERHYAGKVLHVDERRPDGQLARDAIVQLYLAGRLFRKARMLSEQRLTVHRLGAELAKRREIFADPGDFIQEHLEDWAARRIGELGVETGDDLQLLSPSDLTAPDVPAEVKSSLEESYPTQLQLGDIRYRLEYQLDKRQVICHQVGGTRKTPPPVSFFPRFAGLKLIVEAGGTLHTLRQR